MTTKNSPTADDLTEREKEMVKIWVGLEGQFDNLNSQLTEFKTTIAAQGNKPLIFYIQGFEAISATFLLLRSNMSITATATARLSFEHLFCAAACNIDSTYFEKLEASDQLGIYTWLENQSQKTKPTLKHLKLSDIAETGQVKNLYNDQYRFLSKTGAHANTLVQLSMSEAHKHGMPTFFQSEGVLAHLKIGLEEWKHQWAQLTN